jgi:hypothetical protein
MMFALLLVALAPCLRADEKSEEIALQRKLDTPIDSLDLNDIELPKAFDELAAKGKISLQVDPACYDLLPYGETTKVNKASFRQTKLRDAVDSILNPLALDQAVSGDKIIITPSAPLRRIGRRATWEEILLLKAARQESLPGLSGGNLAQSIRTVLSKDTLQLHIATANEAAHNAAIEQVRRQLPCEVWKALDIYSRATNQIWFVSDNAIEVMPTKQWIERQFERRIVLSKLNSPLVECVSELSHLSGIHFKPEPGLYAAYPAVTLNSKGGTVREILDTLRGVIGIDYEVQDDMITLKKASTEPGGGAAAPAARQDPILGQITVKLDNGTDAVIFLRESMLGPEAAEQLRKKTQASIEELKRKLSPLPPVPATAPASTQSTQGNP